MSRLLKTTHDNREENHGVSSMNNTAACPLKHYNVLQLPNHIIVEILSKIPFTTLIRCKCVCKSWGCLLSDPKIIKYLSSLSPPPSLFLRGGNNPDQKGLFLVDLDDKSTPNGFQLKLSNDRIVGSCNGFLSAQNFVFRGKDGVDYLFYLANPVTGEIIPVSNPNRQFSLVDFAGFGFSPTSGVYKLVVVKYSLDGTSEIMVLTVGSGVWRSIGDSEPYLIMNPNFGVYLNGFLHWIAMCKKAEYSCSVLCCFDVETERLQELPVPPLQLMHGTKWDCGVLNGCLCVTHRSDKNISVWVMKEYGVAESWALEFDITVASDASLPGTKVLKFTEKGQLLLLLEGKLMAYTPGKGGVQVVEVDGILPSLDDGILHTPSFVSPKEIVSPDRQIS